MNYQSCWKKSMIPGILLLCLLSPLAWGEEVDLEEVRALALANSRSLARYKLSAQAGVLEEKSRIHAYLPSPSLGSSASILLWGEQRLGEGGSESAILDTFNATPLNFSLSQKIRDGGKNGVLRAINALGAEITRKEALAEYYGVLDQADGAYFAYLQGAAALETAEALLETATLALSLAELRLDAGVVTYGDYLEALADKESRETSRNQARRDLSLNRTKLARLTGLGDPEPRAIDFTLHEGLIQRLAALDDGAIRLLYQDFRGALGAQNPALAKAGLLSQQADRAVALAKRDYVPTLNAQIGTGLNYSPKGGFTLSGGRFSLSGVIPLDFWVTGNNVAKKQLALEEADLNYRNTEASLDLDLETAILDAVAQAGMVLSSRRSYEYANRHFDYVQERFRLAQDSVSTLKDAAALVSSNRNQLIKAQYGFLTCISRLRTLGAFGDDQEVLRLLGHSGASSPGK